MTVAQASPANSPANDRRAFGAPRAVEHQAPPAQQSIRYLKGVGPHRLSQLEELGIATVEDACYYPPSRYEDRTRLLPIRDARPGQAVTVRGRVITATLRRIRRGQTIFEIVIGDGTGLLRGLWFNQPYLAQQLQAGDELLLYGEVQAGPRPQIIHPELERVEAGDEASVHMGRIVPVYPLASGISQRQLRQIIATAVARGADRLTDVLPEPLRARRGWPALSQAVRDLHFPRGWPALQLARERLAFEELFLFQLALARRRARALLQRKPQSYQIEGELLDGLRRRLPFALTEGQQGVLRELFRDLAQPSPMHRLLQGDVGCGKTILLIHCIAVAVQSGHQVALMAPTELLAEQHARVIRSYLGPLGVSVGVLSHGVAPAERKRLTAEIAAGRLPVVIGTHALIQSGVSFPRLALVIIDEQHKFGVVQRAHLARKAQAPDVLVVTATPIPRTLALSIYGDLDVSTVTELPAGRRPVTTLWMRDPQRQQLYALVREQLSAGRQGYVVYPLVEPVRLRSGLHPEHSRGMEERSTRELRAATQMARRLQADVFPEFAVGLLHGQMKPRQKDAVMQAFAAGELRLLVSTVIVEVGLDVPNATVMVIEHPERFGLAQLHQLRGRIGRGAHPATCVVISDSADEGVEARLKAFVGTADGFELAEQDLKQRGPGQLLGRRQHGWLRFRIADLARDAALLESAQEEAERLIRRDPELRGSDVAALRRTLAVLRQQSA
jgi:ATP-dependent DNA helicase RecG